MCEVPNQIEDGLRGAAASAQELGANLFKRSQAEIAASFTLAFGSPARFSHGAHGGPLMEVVCGSERCQLLYQVGHEAFHSLWERDVFHWVHEYFADDLSLKFLRKCGLYWYVPRNERDLREKAKTLTLESMMTNKIVPPYPHGLNGRAFVTGNALAAEVGWDQLMTLAAIVVDQPDSPINAWLETLSPSDRMAAIEVLGPPSTSWV